jgi:hypothetical protein
MITRFLPREIGSAETGPQIFAGTEILNTTFIFSHLLDSISSVLVQNAGLNSINNTYNYITQLNGKPYYNSLNNNNLFMVYFNNQWGIYDFTFSSDPIYLSNENVQYPWNINIWECNNLLEEIFPPVPTVTQII